MMSQELAVAPDRNRGVCGYRNSGDSESRVWSDKSEVDAINRMRCVAVNDDESV